MALTECRSLGLVGVNNRNLKTLTTSLDVFPELAKRIPDDVIKVAESGMQSADDVKRMADAGAKAVLVGESLMTAERRSERVDFADGDDHSLME